MSAAITLWIAKNWSSIQKPTPDLANRLLTADERVKFWLIDLHCVTFILLVNINEYINRHLCWNYAHPSVATTGWLWMQDFSRNKPKHLHWLDTWHFSTEYCVHYYCKLIMSMKFIINTHTYPIHISSSPPSLESWLLDIYWVDCSCTLQVHHGPVHTPRSGARWWHLDHVQSWRGRGSGPHSDPLALKGSV